MKTISSRDNKIIKLILSLGKKNGRQKTGLFIAEGKRISEEALLFGREFISFFVVSDSFYVKNSDFGKDFEIYKIPDALFSSICDTETPQGVLSVLKIPSQKDSNNLSSNVIILDGVSEPGNMGTILRTADAMGFNDIFITKGSADVFSPKVVRSTMGAIFRLNFHFVDNLEFLSNLKTYGYTIISTALRNSVSLESVPIFPKNAIVIGNEANGVSKEILDNSDIITKIDMVGKAESLNAAVASGIVMYRFSHKEG